VTNAELLDELYGRFWKDGDWHAGAEIMAPDIEWIGMGDDATLGGTRHGPRAVNQFFAEWLEAWEVADVDWTTTEVTSDVLLVESRIVTRGRGSGLESETEIGQVWEFSNGRVVRQTLYRTPEEARRAVESLR
jgi:ketosteroid isomerase-like protein